MFLKGLLAPWLTQILDERYLFLWFEYQQSARQTITKTMLKMYNDHYIKKNMISFFWLSVQMRDIMNMKENKRNS